MRDTTDTCCCCEPQQTGTPAVVGLFVAAGALIMLVVVIAARVFDLIVRFVFWLVELITWAVETYRARPKPPSPAERLRRAEERSIQAEQAAGLRFDDLGRLLP